MPHHAPLIGVPLAAIEDDDALVAHVRKHGLHAIPRQRLDQRVMLEAAPQRAALACDPAGAGSR